MHTHTHTHARTHTHTHARTHTHTHTHNSYDLKFHFSSLPLPPSSPFRVQLKLLCGCEAELLLTCQLPLDQSVVLRQCDEHVKAMEGVNLDDGGSTLCGGIKHHTGLAVAEQRVKVSHTLCYNNMPEPWPLSGNGI